MHETNKCHFGDCRESMRKMISDGVKVQMCVTSPPYYGLRDYGHPEQLGLEETPEQYIANMIEVFKLVKDLLADDGVLWLNIGDSYSGSCGNGVTPQTRVNLTDEHFKKFGNVTKNVRGLKPKDLIGIPWMLAFALRADGWYLRQDIIWAKPNPMPESVTDRCTKSHEYIFLLSKSQKYYFDNEAIKENAINNPERERFTSNSNHIRSDYHTKHKSAVTPGQTPHSKALKRMQGGKDPIYENRNKRSVWTVNTKPYSGAHFAVFPEELIEPCILAGSRIGDIILDPFFGSGTTGRVSQNLGRQWIGCELNRDYEQLQADRTVQAGIVYA